MENQIDDVFLTMDKEKRPPYLKWIVIGAVATLIPLQIIAFYTGWKNIVPIGSSLGSVIFLIYKVQKLEAQKKQ
ncbi:hypothetical protein [Flammeovirga pacifica]|uniref:Uncharacterized protein n=1 Tax=Flammeovirga pacifica TaxID=915059 RepID=A0A1S1YSM1_FLAPC|nr:hypothetical protein [Flammeovirga pacifica]OHX64020.1 hypothetical protein NH26_20645 [Flammeovirga pacifica]